MTQLGETLAVEADGWRLVETGWDPDRAVAVGSNFMCGNGYLGYRGTAADQGSEGFVALVVSDTYDCADGHWRELTTAPNPLLVTATVDGRRLGVEHAAAVETWLDLRIGEFGQRATYRVGDATVTVEVERFASYDDLHLIAQRWRLTADRDADAQIEAGIDADIWSLNGTHLPDVTVVAGEILSTATGTTVESGTEVAVAVAHQRLGSGSELGVESAAVVATSSDMAAPADYVREAASKAAAEGYEALREASRIRWEQIWRAQDVRIEGSPGDDAALRFSAYHNRICAPAHTDHLPLGARGLSCQAYQGAAFWDQEIYNLPAFLFTEPHIARALLQYRHGTLDGARRKAARLGYDGAYYAWISGDTGDELCPDIFFHDVLTGRPIRNHFNVWQMHVSPDVVAAVANYVEVTGDDDYLVDHGAEIAFEVARFLRSFVRYDEWRGVYHCIRLLGPDEWHENVDDNAFTNYQTHRALGFAVDTAEWLAAEHPDRLAALGVSAEEVDGWRRVRDRLLLPRPDETTRLVEQFDGFFELEDITPGALAERLLDPSEYWGWPNGIAVRTQVSKQADVAMLTWLHEDAFDTETVRANYEYYEPRCSHNSSLSHAAFGMVATRIGLLDRALQHFRATARVDLLNTNHAVVGGTFIGGIHTAACGGTYQLAVHGFGGLGYRDGHLTVAPALPSEWESISYPVRWRDQSLAVSADHDSVELTASPDNDAPVTVMVRGVPIELEPGASATG